MDSFIWWGRRNNKILFYPREKTHQEMMSLPDIQCELAIAYKMLEVATCSILGYYLEIQYFTTLRFYLVS